MFMESLVEYFLRIAPGFGLLAVIFLLARKKSLELSLLILLLGFILLRDAMTPVGFWDFGAADSFVFWMRFTSDPTVLITLGISSLILTATVVALNKHANTLIYWGKFSLKSVSLGLFGATIVVAPFLAIYQLVPASDRGGSVVFSVLPAIFFIALAGNFMEEVLFRGYWQGYFKKQYGTKLAIVLSGMMFSAGHIFLASTVTSVGVGVLVFTLYEGLICAFVASKQGVVASTITHAMAIFVLASGI